MEGLLARASEIYAVDYFGAIIVVALLELIVPRRAAGDELTLRWTSNFGIAILGTLMMRTVFPAFGLLGAALHPAIWHRAAEFCPVAGGRGFRHHGPCARPRGLRAALPAAPGRLVVAYSSDPSQRHRLRFHDRRPLPPARGAHSRGRRFCRGHGARRATGVCLHFDAA